MGLSVPLPLQSPLVLFFFYLIFLQFLKCNMLPLATGPLHMKTPLPGVLFSSLPIGLGNFAFNMEYNSPFFKKTSS